MATSTPRRLLYSPILSRVRVALIRRMPKPEEVLIVEDENGEIVRETMKDTDAITLYKVQPKHLPHIIRACEKRWFSLRIWITKTPKI